MHRHSNHVLVAFQAALAIDEDDLSLDWADFVGDTTPDRSFEVHTDDPRDVFIGIQAFDVGEYGHEVYVNDVPLTGFDIPPSTGWQYWMDTVTGGSLTEGTNTIRIERDATGDDAFAVGTVRVQWTEPAEP